MIYFEHEFRSCLDQVKTKEAKGPAVYDKNKQKSKKHKQTTVYGTDNLFDNFNKALVSPLFKAVDPTVSAAQGSADTANNSDPNAGSNKRYARVFCCH